MFTVYRYCTLALLPLILIWLLFRIMRGKETWKSLPERLGFTSYVRGTDRLLYFHAASVGEAMSLLPLIQRVHDTWSDVSIILTTGTVASSRLITTRLPARVFHQRAPVDCWPCMGHFFRRVRPDATLLVESELWPVFILTASHYGPLILLNATLSARSLQQWQLCELFAQPLLQHFDMITSASDEDAARFSTLIKRPVSVLPPLKWAAPDLPADPDRLASLQQAMAGRHLWAATSTHDPEEAIILEAHQQLKALDPSILTIIAPRHLARCSEIIEASAKQGLTVARHSLGDAITAESDIYLWDSMGELGLCYRLVDIAFIGGSLAPVGGHNAIEAIRLDTIVMTGPHTFKSQALLAPFEAKKWIIRVHNADDIATSVMDFMGNKSKIRAHIAAQKSLLKSPAYVLQHYFNRIAQAVGRSS